MCTLVDVRFGTQRSLKITKRYYFFLDSESLARLNSDPSMQSLTFVDFELLRIEWFDRLPT